MINKINVAGLHLWLVNGTIWITTRYNKMDDAMKKARKFTKNKLMDIKYHGTLDA